MKTQTLPDLQCFFERASHFVWDWYLEIQERIENDIDELICREAEDRSIPDDVFSARYHYLKTQLANTHRYSALPMLVGVFERTFKQFCRLSIPDYAQLLRNENGDWFIRHRRLLVSNGFSLDDVLTETDQLVHLLELRNCIVHAFGEVDACRNPKSVRTAIAAIDDTAESIEGYLFVNSGTVATAKCATRFVMEHLFQKVG